MEETLSFSAIKLLNEKIKIGSEKLYNTFNRLTNPFWFYSSKDIIVTIMSHNMFITSINKDFQSM